MLNPDAGPVQLQAKVMFDIRFYFCRRGGENLTEMTKETFSLEFDTEIGIAYVKKAKDELTKNQKQHDTEMVTGFMPQMLGPNGQPHKMCPVRSFENYIAHLISECNSLWQRPKKKISHIHQLTWYDNMVLGHNPIDNFMSKLSTKCQLSMRYTNHCIRVTGITTLRRGKFNEKQVMSVTGHKSLESLAIYQRVQSDEKLMMGFCLTYSLLNPEEVYRVKAIMQKELEDRALQELDENLAPMQAIAPANIRPPIHQQALLPTVPPLANQQNTGAQGIALHPPAPEILPVQNALVPAQPNANVPLPSDVPDFDLQAILQDFHDDNPDDDQMLIAAAQIETDNTTTTTRKAIVKKTNSPRVQPKDLFQNCSFNNVGTINIHIHKA